MPSPTDHQLPLLRQYPDGYPGPFELMRVSCNKSGILHSDVEESTSIGIKRSDFMHPRTGGSSHQVWIRVDLLQVSEYSWVPARGLPLLPDAMAATRQER